MLAQRAQAQTCTAPCYAVTQAETNANVSPTNPAYPPGNILRYGADPTGAARSDTALLNAGKVAIAQLGMGMAGVPVYIPAGTYWIATPPVWAQSPNFQPLVIQGDGWGSQLVNKAPSGSPTFDMTGHIGWTIRDLCLCGDATYPNDGIHIGTVNGAQTQQWTVENVLSLMPGRGIVCADTNTGTIRNFTSWPGITAGLLQSDLNIASSAIYPLINHHIHLTGNFCHNISIIDARCNPDKSYKAGMRGIKMDTTTSEGVSIFGGLFQTLSGSNNLETGIDINPTSVCQNLLISGVYMEGTILALNNLQFCNIGPVTVGGSGGGGTLLVSNTLCTTFSGVYMGTGTISSGSNTFLGCAFPIFADTGSPANIYLNCDLSTVLISHQGI